MATELIITGTGCPIPSAHRAGPGALVRCGDVAVQFDVGRGTLARLTEAGVAPGDLDAVCLTHHHSDHLTGLQDLVLTRWVMDRDDAGSALSIVAPAGPSARFVEHMLDPWADDIDVRLEHTGRTHRPTLDIRSFEVVDPGAPVEVWSSGDVRVLAGPVRHEPVHPAVGYRVETPDGVVAITGDTLVCDEVARLADGADVLAYEAMRFEVIERLPRERQFILDYHADTRLIGAQAAELGVPTLVLTHLIPEPRTDADEQSYVDDVRSGGYEGEVIVARDLASVSLS